MSVAVLPQMKNNVPTTATTEDSKEEITADAFSKKDSDKNEADKDKTEKEKNGCTGKASVKNDNADPESEATEEGEGYNFYIIQSGRPSCEDIGAAKSLLQVVEFLAAEVIRRLAV
ncbi:hypothetical protein P154DRAFT_525657 [Amniculicola lignicola CBS 123094]|uniref:Uncharacterized protein n=1 Tax=Amniculicola lignicola CBS 123094 TaxID=1392246 RepID=A0A6A5W5M8_9PLEO|nr:hypothetical protein P154DRAFT_525657 [Amniculicola lignicola CBS 123094]